MRCVEIGKHLKSYLPLLLVSFCQTEIYACMLLSSPPGTKPLTIKDDKCLEICCMVIILIRGLKRYTPLPVVNHISYFSKHSFCNCHLNLLKPEMGIGFKFIKRLGSQMSKAFCKFPLYFLRSTSKIISTCTAIVDGNQ